MASNHSTSVLTQSSTNVLARMATLVAMQQSDPSVYFSANVQRVLDHQALKVNAAATRWKIPQKTLEAIVKGLRVPSIDTAHKVAQAAGYDLWQIYAGLAASPTAR